MKVFEANCVYNYSWDELSTAQWRKYGDWNDKASHVVAVDILSRNIDKQTGILRTERLITCRQAAPAWLTSLIGGEPTSHVYETSYVDPVRKTLTMCSTNLTWSSALSVRETVTYRPLESSQGSKTEFRQEAKVVALCGGWQKIKNKIEEATIERFSQNAQRGREGFEHVLEMSRRVFGEEKMKEQLQLQEQQVQVV